MLACIQPYDELFLVLDALDECPEGNEVRQNVLEGLERVTQKAGNVRMFITSREVTDVRDSMQTLGAISISLAARSVDADIQRYTLRQLSLNRKLCKLDSTTKNLIRDTISQRADGM
jgi:ankyrin repeat domain-containing protein 50